MTCRLFLFHADVRTFVHREKIDPPEQKSRKLLDQTSKEPADRTELYRYLEFAFESFRSFETSASQTLPFVIYDNAFVFMYDIRSKNKATIITREQTFGRTVVLTTEASTDANYMCENLSDVRSF